MLLIIEKSLLIVTSVEKATTFNLFFPSFPRPLAQRLATLNRKDGRGGWGVFSKRPVAAFM